MTASAARKTPLRVVPAVAPVYQLRIELRDVRPAVWRRLQVPGAVKLHQLHVLLQHTMGWFGGHLHEFIIGGRNYGEPDPDYDFGGPELLREERFTLAGALGVSRTFTYLYDFGDGWDHRIKIEKTLASELGSSAAICLEGANACPPEDVGGPPGYFEFLKAIKDPNHEDHDDMLRWCGGRFDPSAFDLEAINDALRQIKI